MTAPTARRAPSAGPASEGERGATETTDARTVLEGRGLSVSLGGRRVLEDASIRADAGRIHVLLGPNGAGKTTLLRALQGLVPREAGEVHQDGAIGYVPQRHDIDWDFPVTAKDVVQLGLVQRRLLDVRRLLGPTRPQLTAVADALERVRMLDLRDRPIGEMSGGQRQRVMIARALVRRPSVLLLDEPFTGLDMPSQELLSDLFRDLAADGCAIIMSTHDLTHALDIADRATLLNRTVIASGAPAELRDAELWQRTFEVGPTSPLLRQIGAFTC
ncbi:anchored repeat-type ABC transporter ATP-binding subunit [Helcobacillus sp. ACRRO]|uniref:anchored repeat-type ABC transporter ATP-binding subunit n=1 Tax=Helcobacillus sp. ACRRO TaxID=2918202 RepID=UPI001EF5766E|nr:anchored repeat-type ABC transporter ATP-binding subunit [Helcobacillus sp. ACRRO]